MAMNLRSSTATGIMNIGFARIIQQPVNLVVTLVLANILNPKDFGVIGIVTIFTSFISVFANLGLGSAIIQRTNVTNNQLSTLFWIGLAFGVLSSSILLIISYPISLFYNEPLLIKLIMTLSLIFCISPLYQINRKLLEKSLNFKTIANIEIVSCIISGCFGITSALLKFGVWSLVIQSLSGSVIICILFRYFQKWTPSIHFEFKECKEMLLFGLQTVGAYFTAYFERNIDFFLIGKIFGATQLGYYSLAFRIMYYPVRNISNIFSEVLFPAFSKVQNNLISIKRGYLESIKYICASVLPFMIIIFCFCEYFIRYLFGEKWMPTALILKFLIPASVFHAIWQLSWAVLPAIGKAAVRMKVGILQSFLLATGILVGSNWGLSGVVIGVSLSAVVIWIITQHIINKMIGLSFSEVFMAVKKSILSTFINTLIICVLKMLANDAVAQNALILIVLFALSIITTSIIHYLYFKKEIKSSLNMIFSRTV